MTFNEFLDSIDNLQTKYTNRDLETYLLATYGILTDNRAEYLQTEPTLELMLDIIEKSFTATPHTFDNTWLEITDAPDINRMLRKFTNPELSVEIGEKEILSNPAGLEHTLEILKFQIAELHKMRGKQLENEYRYFGINSETGNRWYNFDPFTNLECGTRCSVDNEDETSTIDWGFIGNLLEDGRVYE